MNETLKNIFERYSCRDYADTPLSDEQVKYIIDAALAAPSAVNRQPWRITVVTNKAFIDEMDADGMNTLASDNDKSSYNRMMERGGKLFYNAPCMFVVTGDGSDWAMLDSGILCQNIVLAAQSLGLGSCMVGMFRIPLEGARGDEFKKRLMFKDGYSFTMSVIAGTILSGKEPHELDHEKVTYIK